MTLTEQLEKIGYVRPWNDRLKVVADPVLAPEDEAKAEALAEIKWQRYLSRPQNKAA